MLGPRKSVSTHSEEEPQNPIPKNHHKQIIWRSRYAAHAAEANSVSVLSLMQATIVSDHTFAILASTQITFMKHGEDGRKLSLHVCSLHALYMCAVLTHFTRLQSSRTSHVCSPHAHTRKFTNLEVAKLLASVHKKVRRKITTATSRCWRNKLKRSLYYVPVNSVKICFLFKEIFPGII